MSGITRRTACSVCGVGEPDDGWAYWKGGLPYCHECYKSNFEGIEKETEIRLCHVCGLDITNIGCGRLKDEFYCTECYYVELLNALHCDEVCGEGNVVPETDKCDTTTADMKSSNPKDLAAVTRVPMHLWPMTATVYGCAAIYEGMRKYGYYNWRHDKVSIMTYVAALQRHLFRYVGGQWADKNSGATHLGHILACLAILVDAHESGQIIDDRPIAGPDVERLMKETEKVIEGMAERHKDKHPVHYYRGTEGKQ